MSTTSNNHRVIPAQRDLIGSIPHQIKYMKKIILSIVGLLFFMILSSNHSFAYTGGVSAPSLPLPSVNPVNYLKKTLNNYAPQTQGINMSVPTLQNLRDLKNLLPKNLTGGNTGISKPTSNTASFSSGDVTSSLKAIGTLAINLFLIIIQTVAGILKALLPFLAK